ncbi:MAG: hypothetical protein SPJ13_02960 [Bacteroidales bacterium]|nr:hypothetical protein [Bacteroidales bacterium]
MNYRKILFLATAIAALLLMATACKKHYDEFYFKGVVVYPSLCGATSTSYLMEILSPTGVGDTMTFNGTFLHNAVMAYMSPKVLRVNDTLYGVAYPTEDYAVLHCNILLFPDLPEIGLLSVDEDPSVVERQRSDGKGGIPHTQETI